jgi:hypothetical protein
VLLGRRGAGRGAGGGSAGDVPLGGRPVVGRGALLYPDPLGPAVGPLDPSASALASLVVAGLAQGHTFGELEPRYLRRPDVTEPGARKSVLG